MPVDDAFGCAKSLHLFLTKKLRKHKNNNKTLTINLEKQKTTLIKRSTCKDAGKGKTLKKTINLWMPVDNAMF